MSLVFSNPNLAADQPQTHALIIGVSAYRHLRGGSLYDTQPAPFNLGLAQLTSPSVSAIAITNWLLTSHRNQFAPLGSVELLLSPATQYLDPNGNAFPVDSATFNNIEAAFDQWVARCDTSNQNVALFYFCGHGLDYTTMTLLTEDFGANQWRPWANAIDFGRTYWGMNDCRAETQCFIIDACREAPPESIRSNGFEPRALKTSQLISLPARSAPIIKSSLQGKTASAAINEVSDFTQELIRTLNGFGADRKVGKMWQVTPESLSQGLTFSLGLKGIRCSIEGGIQLHKRVIHEIPDPVKCLVKVTCSPPEQHQSARLMMTKYREDPPKIYTRNPSPEPWTQEVESGIYKVEALFNPGSYKNIENPDFIVYPPEQICPLP